jgi:AraC-like DNA-binding protein
LSYAANRGADVGGLLTRFGLGPDAVTAATVLVTWPQVRDFGRAASELLGEPLLGMKIALSRYNRIGGTVEALLANCPDTAARFVQIERVEPLFSPATKTTVVRTAREIGLTYETPGDPLGPGAVNGEWTIVRLVEAIRVSTRVEVVPTEVWFAHDAPLVITPLIAYFGTSNIRFGAKKSGFFVDVEVGALPVVNADPTVFAIVDRVAEGELKALEHTSDVLPKVRSRIRAGLEDGAARLDVIARQLGMSERTLQRRIGDGGTSFAALVDDERRDIALRLVVDAQMDLHTVPEILGYEHKDAFARAFKRWTGTTPPRFRARSREDREPESRLA